MHGVQWISVYVLIRSHVWIINTFSLCVFRNCFLATRDAFALTVMWMIAKTINISYMNSLDVCSLPIFDKSVMIHVPSIKSILTRLLCPSNIRCEWILGRSIVQYVRGTFYGRVHTCCLLRTSNKSHWDIFQYFMVNTGSF